MYTLVYHEIVYTSACCFNNSNAGIKKFYNIDIRHWKRICRRAKALRTNMYFKVIVCLMTTARVNTNSAIQKLIPPYNIQGIITETRLNKYVLQTIVLSTKNCSVTLEPKGLMPNNVIINTYLFYHYLYIRVLNKVIFSMF